MKKTARVGSKAAVPENRCVLNNESVTVLISQCGIWYMWKSRQHTKISFVMNREKKTLFQIGRCVSFHSSIVSQIMDFPVHRGT